MNAVIRTLLAHRSIRSYVDTPIPEEYLGHIVKSVQAAPNWVNFQLVSIVAVKNKERRAVFSRLCDNQKQIVEAPVFLIFCADYHRVHLASQKAGINFDTVFEDIDPLIVAAHEVGIAVGTAVAAAESLGLGSVVIGDVRKNATEVVKELSLPKYVVPILGLCLGYANEEPGLKPRLSQEAIYFEERYNSDTHTLIDDYDEQYSRYLKIRPFNNRVGNWSEMASEFYATPYHYHGVADMLRQQGLLPYLKSGQ